MRVPVAAIVLWAGLTAGAANAQSAPAAAAAPALDLSSAKTSFAVRYEAGDEPRIRGVAKTAVERRLSEGGLTGSMGFMCGLEPGKTPRGGPAMRGHDPTGRFVGARLALTFR